MKFSVAFFPAPGRSPSIETSTVLLFNETPSIFSKSPLRVLCEVLRMDFILRFDRRTERASFCPHLPARSASGVCPVALSSSRRWDIGGRTSVSALVRHDGERASPSKTERPARARPTASRRNAGRGSPGFSWQRTRFQSSPRRGASLTRLADSVLKRHRVGARVSAKTVTGFSSVEGFDNPRQ